MRRRVSKDESRAARRALSSVAAAFEGFRPAREVLSKVRAVQTDLIQFDLATGVGGMPIERFGLCHGPSGDGKTLAMLAFLGSFVRRGHFGLHIDAERTTPIDFARTIMGEAADSDRFFALRPPSYEKTTELVRDWLMRIVKLRDGGKVPADTSAIIVVDSLRKLVPEGLLQQLFREAKAAGGKKEAEKKLKTRAGQIKAGMNAAWMDEVTVLLERAQACMIAIEREMVDPDASAFAKRFGTDYKVGGGAAIYYDSSLAFRVERASYVTDGKKGDDGEFVAPKVYGERHRITIRKTKVAGREDKVTRCFFHSSNGVLVRAGLDPARDLVELGLRLGVVRQAKGAWLTYQRQKWQGENAAVRKLYASPEVLESLERDVRAAMRDTNAETGECE